MKVLYDIINENDIIILNLDEFELQDFEFMIKIIESLEF